MRMKTMLAYLMLGGAVMLSACNTVRGVGRDVQSVGQAVENSSR